MYWHAGLINYGWVTLAFYLFLFSVSHISVNLPHYVAGVMLEENSIYIKLYAKLGLSVTWNKDDAVMVISLLKFIHFARKTILLWDERIWVKLLATSEVGWKTAEIDLVQVSRKFCATHKKVMEWLSMLDWPNYHLSREPKSVQH